MQPSPYSEGHMPAAVRAAFAAIEATPTAVGRAIHRSSDTIPIPQGLHAAPCPFCGGVELALCKNPGYVICCGCGGYGPSASAADFNEGERLPAAVALWNTRNGVARDPVTLVAVQVGYSGAHGTDPMVYGTVSNDDTKLRVPA